MAIIAWTFRYILFSFNLSWGQDTESFFYSFLHLSESPFDLGGLHLDLLIPLLAIWVVNFAVLALGVKKGIEKANKVFMPILFISIIIITIRGLTLPGAFDGLNYFFKPDFSKILDGRVWVAAYGQIFYSLSICFGIMLAYSSYLPKKSDIVNNAFITAFGNCSFSLLSGIAVFSILGNMALNNGKAVADIADGGVGLAFIVFPAAINGLPSFNQIFGVLFFVSLFFAGVSSSISIIETTISAVSDKFNIDRMKSLGLICGVGFVGSTIFATGAGLYVLDIADHFLNNYGVAIVGLIETILVGWIFNLRSIREYVNPISDFTVGNWWQVSIKIITPLLLGIMTMFKIIEDIRTPYGDYSIIALMTYGVGVIVVTVVVGLIVSSFRGSDNFQASLKKRSGK
jgi:NSS family neurotransmitter:Na+ symporter